MTEEWQQNMMNLNFRLLMLLGMVTPLLIDYKDLLHKSNHYKVDWFMDAINAVVYENKPIPPLPEKVLL
jgi:hypothetical protein